MLIRLVTIFVVYAAATSVGEKCALEPDIDYQGNDIRYISNVSDADVCCSYCQKEPTCVVFTLMGSKDIGQPWAGRCYLKKAMQRRHNYKTHISGVMPGRHPIVPTPSPPVPTPVPVPSPVIWNGGGVALFANYSYTATLGTDASGIEFA